MIQQSLSHTDLNCTYWHASNQNFYEKITSSLVHIDTPYVVVCPDDDFILWQNIKYLHDVAVSNNATTVCGRELTYKNRDNTFIFSEVSRYRKFCIHSQESKLRHLIAGMNPIVCTYYQLYKTTNFRDIWTYLNSQKEFMPGNKFVEILFRSACFIDGPVHFCNKLLRIVGEEAPLRHYDNSKAVSQYTLNFGDEYNAMINQNLMPPYIDGLSKYISAHFSVDFKIAKKIAVEEIINPMISRMQSKHEILWSQPYSLIFSHSLENDNCFNTGNSVNIGYSLQNREFRKPALVANLDDYLIPDEEEWSNMLTFLDFLGAYGLPSN